MSSSRQKRNQQSAKQRRGTARRKQFVAGVVSLVLLAGLALLTGQMSWGELTSLVANGLMQPSQSAQPVQSNANGYAFSLTGRVEHVADGDTLTIQVGNKRERVRLASIDAPETSKDKGQPGQPMAQQSRQALVALVSGKTLTLQCYEQDHYQRNICDVMLPGGVTANQKQVEQGMAWANMEKRGRFLRDDSLRELESQARRERLGIWQRNDAVAPWVWRYQCWQQGKCS